MTDSAPADVAPPSVTPTPAAPSPQVTSPPPMTTMPVNGTNAYAPRSLPPHLAWMQYASPPPGRTMFMPQMAPSGASPVGGTPSTSTPSQTSIPGRPSPGSFPRRTRMPTMPQRQVRKPVPTTAPTPVPVVSSPTAAATPVPVSPNVSPPSISSQTLTEIYDVLYTLEQRQVASETHVATLARDLSDLEDVVSQAWETIHVLSDTVDRLQKSYL